MTDHGELPRDQVCIYTLDCNADRFVQPLADLSGPRGYTVHSPDFSPDGGDVREGGGR